MSLGVIVGRFQVPELHPGHRYLISSVLSNHKQVLIILGVSPFLATYNNPLDFETRKQMILETYPNILIDGIEDCYSDEIWSNKLDILIEKYLSQLNLADAILYGSRDSFIKYYYGKYQTKQIEPKIKISGSFLRKRITNEVKSSPDFRAGVIWATGNQIPFTRITVDLLLMKDGEILLARNYAEDQLRFIGSFVRPAESLEYAAIRTAKEKLGIEVLELGYEKSFFIDDWRYSKERSKITTALFNISRYSKEPNPVSPKLDILEWWNPKHIPLRKVIPHHRVLLNYVEVKYGKIKSDS